jgi:mono/diheme cytochrome c family protein
MTRLRVRILILCAAIAVTMAGCSDRIGRGWDWNRMRVQPRYEPYRTSRFFPNGMSMQHPPVGTVSREAGAALEDTAPATASMLTRGRSQFHVYCAVCHGDRGDGISLVARNMDAPLPTSLITPPVTLMPARAVASVIANGIGTMPAFSADLSAADRKAVAEYVTSLH